MNQVYQQIGLNLRSDLFPNLHPVDCILYQCHQRIRLQVFPTPLCWIVIQRFFDSILLVREKLSLPIK